MTFKPEDGIDLVQLVDFLITRRRFLPPDSLARLQNEFGISPDSSRVEDEYDLLTRLNKLMQVADVVFDSLVDVRSGTLLTEDIKAINSAVSSTTSLMALVQKIYGDVMNQSRLRQIELATIDTIRSLPPEGQEKFFTSLAQRLEKVT